MFPTPSGAASVAALLLCAGTAAFANKAPAIKNITAKGPGIATITFAHDDLFGLTSYAAQRLAGGTWQDAVLANTPDSDQERTVTVTFLVPNMEHALRLCAIYGTDRYCSDERHVRTPPLPVDARNPVPAILGHDASETGLRVHFRATSNYDFYLLRWKRAGAGGDRQIRSPGGGMGGALDITGLRDGTEHQMTIQGCRRVGNGSACSASSAPYRAMTAFAPLQPPQLRPRALSERRPARHRPDAHCARLRGRRGLPQPDITLKRDGVLVHDARAEGRMANPMTDIVPRPNRLYRYEMCFVRGESACSPVFEVRPPPVTPTAPADARVSISRRWKGLRMGRQTLEAVWRNTEAPGAMVTVERGEGGANAAGFRWQEIGRIDTRDDPTSLSVEIAPLRGAGKQAAGAYRVCSVVPELGEAGRACTETTAR